MSRAVLLSASVPDPERDPRFYKTGDVVAIRDAVRALAATALARGFLVFGGHPAISPLVRQVAESASAVDRVVIFQSRLYEQQILRDSAAFTNIHWTEKVGEDKEKSLRLMREVMIRSRVFTAAVFIGGMEGVLDEYALFAASKSNRGARRLPIASTGAAAAELLGLDAGENDPDLVRALTHDRAYGALFDRLLGPRPRKLRA